MWVKVISRFKDRETGEYHDPGTKVNLTKENAKRLAAAGCVELPSRKKGPSENKAKVPSEDKGAG